MTIRESRTRLRAAEKAYNVAKPGRDLTEARQELTIARAEYQAACVDMVSQLEEVLEPWHGEASMWCVTCDDSEGIFTARDCSDLTGSRPEEKVTIGDLRRLSSIYREICDDA